MKKALENNDLLRYIVASDVAGRFMMTANEVDAAARAGTKIKSQVDLNAFIENASDEQKAALGAELGIAEGEWATMSLKRFNQAAAAYRESGKLGQRRAEMKAAEQNKNAYAGEAVGETVDSGKLTVESSADVAKTLKTAENAELTSINGENMSVSGGKSVRFSIDNGNGAPFVAKLTVEEYDVDGKNRAYNLQRIEMSDLQRAQYAQLISENKEKYAYKSDALSVAQLFDFVKRYDEEFKPKSVNPALLNEDGTPKVFYHGTRSQFTTFELQDKPKFGRALGDGFYFTPDYDKAFKFANGLFSKGQDRGGIIMPVYLRMENPYVIEKDADRTKWAKEYNAGKYDGIIDLKNDTYYVENPGQIKSATDNIGTFDGKNKDIRYSKDITPKLSDDASVGLRMEDENGNLVPLRLEGFTDEKGRLIQEKSGDASKGATKRLRKSDRLSPKTFERLKKDGGRVIISDELYEKIVRRSDKATARKLKGRLGYSEKAEARRKEEAELLGRSFKPKESISAEDYVKEIAATEKIQSINPSDVVGALIEIDRLYRVNRDGGKAYRLEVENERLTEQNRELNSQSRENLQSQVDYLAKKLGELKDATFFNASQYRTGELKSSILKLAGIKWRGKDSANHVRTLARQFSEWYDPKKNEMLGYISDDNPGLYDADMKETIDELAKGDSEYLTNDELEDLIRVLEFAKTFAERFSKVYYDGKWVDSLPEAQRHVKAAKKGNSLNSRWVAFKHAVFGFLKALGDPLSVVKMADRYNPDGFFTTFYERIERAEMNARVTEMETLGDFDKFFDKKENKGYAKKLMQEECEYLGNKLRKTQLIDIYMSLKSQTALPGLAFSGFEFTNKQGYEERVNGFIGDVAWKSDLWSTSESERAAAWKKLNKLAAEQRLIIEEQLTAQDMEYISILEAGYLKTKALKDVTDDIKFGYKRTKSGYYLPTVRANVAKSVQSLYTQVDLVNNISANKHTKEGTVSELYIGDSTAKFKGHVKAISNYAHLSVEIDNYNKVFNLDVGDNPNRPTSVKTETVNAWRTLGIVGKNGAKMTKEHGGSAYMMSIIDSITGTPQVKGAFNSFIGRVRGRYAQAVLGANWKSWLSQMQSWIAASGEYSIGDMIKAVGILRKGTFADMDKYCSLAKLRNYDSSAAKAQGVLDEVKGIGAVTMKPTSLVDRFVCALDFCAAQVEVERTTGAKIGSEENLKAAGARLAEVILRTQQNTLASSKNAAARSGSEFAKSIVMFQSDAIKTTGRGIDGLGEYFTLLGERRSMKKNGATAEEFANIDKRISEAGKRAFKANFALIMGAFFAVGIGRLASLVFYGRDEEEEERPLLSLTLEFIGNMLGGLPLIDDAWNRLVDGYEISDSGYSAINDMLDSVDKVFDLAAKSAEGKMTSQESASALRDAVFAFSTLFGIPTKNIYKTGRGLIRIASPNTLYKLEGITNVKNFASDFEEAINAGDEEKAANYNSDRVYDKKDVVTALRGIEGFANLPEDMQNELLRDVWVGMNSRYGKGAREAFVEVMSNKIPYMLLTERISFNFYKRKARFLGLFLISFFGL